MCHENVARLPFCTRPCSCINLCMPRKSSPGPQQSVNTEINTVAGARAKRKAGYFFVAHPIHKFIIPRLNVKYLKSKIHLGIVH